MRIYPLEIFFLCLSLLFVSLSGRTLYQRVAQDHKRQIRDDAAALCANGVLVGFNQDGGAICVRRLPR